MAGSKAKFISFKDYYKIACKPQERRAWNWYIRNILRPVSTRFSYLLVRTPLTPNGASYILLAFGFLSAFFLSLGGTANRITGVILFWLNSIFDAVDGEIARFKKKHSVLGIFLDEINHIMVEPLVLLGIGIGFYVDTTNLLYLIAGFSASLSCAFADALSFARSTVMLKHVPNPEKSSGALSDALLSSSSRRSKFLGFVVKVGEFFFNLTLLEAMITLVVLFALIGHLDWLILFYAVWLPVRLVVVAFLYSRSVALLDRDAE